MATFSQRQGLHPLEKAIQIAAMDGDLRNAIWTALSVGLWVHHAQSFDPYNSQQHERNEEIQTVVARLYIHLFKVAIDDVPDFRAPGYKKSGITALRDIVMNGPWNEVYDIVDFLIQNAPKRYQKTLGEVVNTALQRENAGYRVVGNQIVEITSETEIKAIEDAINTPQAAVKEHLARALELLSDRQNPDYRNSIKESISAVESSAQGIVGKKGATLNDCLRKIKEKKSIHPALEQGLIKLYSWTSDDGGIRHALNDGSSAPSFADAKFMLVACSAFVNYMVTLSTETPTAP